MTERAARRPRRIALLAHMGFGNLGDAASQDAMIHHIRRLSPDAEIFGVTLNPEDTRARHGIASFPVRFTLGTERALPLSDQGPAWPPPRPAQAAPEAPGSALRSLIRRARGKLWNLRQRALFLLRSYRVARRLDLLVISGSGQLSDEWGAWGAPFNIYLWALLAKLAGKRLAFASVGVGPLRTFWSRLFASWALALADDRSFRDVGSLRLVRSIGIRARARIYPDVSYSLPTDRIPRAAGRGSPLVVIGPIPYCHPKYWWKGDERKYGKYVETLASFAAWVLARGYRVAFEANSVMLDHVVISDIETDLARRVPEYGSQQAGGRRTWTVGDALARIAEASFVITSRFHGVIFAHVLNRPTIAVSPHQKVDAAMAGAGQAEYCLPIDTVDPDAIARAFVSLEANRDRISGQLQAREEACRQALQAQHRRLFGAGGLLHRSI